MDNSNIKVQLDNGISTTMGYLSGNSDQFARLIADKEKLESKIEKLIEDFQTDFGVTVYDIDCETIDVRSFNDNPEKLIPLVQLRVEIA